MLQVVLAQMGKKKKNMQKINEQFKSINDLIFCAS